MSALVAVAIQIDLKTPKPKLIDKAAPKLAAEVIPSVEGLAKAFCVIFWI